MRRGYSASDAVMKKGDAVTGENAAEGGGRQKRFAPCGHRKRNRMLFP